MKDVIVIGGGLAGLSAAWRLRHNNLLVLEASPRLGGRIRSERRGKYWLNWGGHVFGGQNSYVNNLLKEVEVESLDLIGSLASFSLQGNDKTNKCLCPCSIPFSWSTKFEVAKTKCKLKTAAKKYFKLQQIRQGEDYRVRQQRILDFMADKTFSDFIGNISPEAKSIFEPIISLSAGNSDDISAAAGIENFLQTCKKNIGLSRNIVGGASTLIQSIARKLGDKVKVEAEVLQVIHHNDHVEVTYRQNGQEITEKAHYCVMATTANIAHNIIKGIDPIVNDALAQIKYGQYVSAVFLTNEVGRQDWDEKYAYYCSQSSFNAVYNMSNLVRAMEAGSRTDGSSFMVLSSAKLAEKLINLSDEEILEIYRNDLEKIFPGFGKIIVEQEVQKFNEGLAYNFLGRNKIQTSLMRPADRVYLAGDYLGTLKTETAIKTGLLAAEDINSKLYC